MIFFFGNELRAQIPSGLPHPDRNDPIDLTNWADLIIYVLIPAAIAMIYFVWIRGTKRLKWPGF